MLIKQIPIRNNLRNYMYLLACEQTLEAIAIDPLNHSLCLKVAQDLGWTIKTVANTHHHHDHIGGNAPVIESTGAELVAHAEAMNAIPNVDRGVQAGESLRCGELHLKVMDTPGHTMSHICLYFSGSDAEKPALFCGDTLFNAGVGRCDFGGDPEVLYNTFVEQIFPLADDVRIFPGHDYIQNNLEFTLDREPDNQAAIDLQKKFVQDLDPESFVSNIGIEREINVFFRLDNTLVREGIGPNARDDKSTFIGLRHLRDNW
ncbi:MAG: hydroxyacylglutathione hydrolase [Gammaproteobacteria bacterium]|nr:hydroxyacylglutathione hydrolase [Gammaproteobacteria bacterium]